MNVLLTGAGGFVGGAIWQRLRTLGWTVLASGRRPIPADDFFPHDLRQPLPPLPGNFLPNVIIHAAARSSPWGSPSDFVADNVTATRHVLDFAQRFAPHHPHVIHLSTAAVLYTHEQQPDLDESTPFATPAINAYAATKQAAETLVTAYPGPSTILRPRAVFGPGDTVLFPRILRAARRGRLPRILADHPVRADLIYIDTLVDYVIRVATSHRTGLYHLSNATPVELWPFLDDVLQRLHLPTPSRSVSARRVLRFAAVLETTHRLLPFLGEPPITRFGVGVFASTKTLNVQKCLRDLGPPSVDLSTGVERFIAWQRQQP